MIFVIPRFLPLFLMIYAERFPNKVKSNSSELIVLRGVFDDFHEKKEKMSEPVSGAGVPRQGP